LAERKRLEDELYRCRNPVTCEPSENPFHIWTNSETRCTLVDTAWNERLDIEDGNKYPCPAGELGMVERCIR
jgi:hypothetical protein